MNGAVTPSASTLATPADANFVPPFQEGQLLLEKYRVERLIGTGGIGYVMSALNIGIEERVALKFLRPEFLSNAEAVRRFTTEARLAAKIQHAHVARVIDVGSLPDAGPFIVMDLLVGRDLNQVLYEDGPLPVELAVDYALQACEALAAAHARRIVHRDVKPDNLFLTRQAHRPDIIKILDFGISKLRPDEFTDNASAVQTNTALGSPSYMAPEQMRASSDIDGRADIWSLGCVLYELLTGHHAFDAPSLMQVCAVVLEQPPLPIGAHGKAVPAELERVILRCLEKERSQRFADVAELAHALAPFASHARLAAAEESNSLAFAWGYPKPATSLLGTLPEPFADALVTELGAESTPLGPASTPWSAPPVAIEDSGPPSTRTVLLRVERSQRKRDYVTAAALFASAAALIVPSVRHQLESSSGREISRVASATAQRSLDNVVTPTPVEKIPVVPVTAAASAAPLEASLPAMLLTDLPPLPPVRAEVAVVRQLPAPAAAPSANPSASAAVSAEPVVGGEAAATSALPALPPVDAIESAALEVIPPATVEPGALAPAHSALGSEPSAAVSAAPSALVGAVARPVTADTAPTASALAPGVLPPVPSGSAVPAVPSAAAPELVTHASPAPGSPSWASAGLVRNVAVAPLPTASSRTRSEAPRRLSSQTVASVARTHTPAVRACLARAQLEFADLKGQVSLTATLDPAGNVVQAKVAGASAPLASCLTASARSWKFPSQPGAAALTSYVLVFE